MAGTTQKVKRNWLKTAAQHISDAVLDPNFAFYTQINNIVTDLATIRAGVFGVFNYKVEDLGAGADITARAFFQAPFALTILDSVKALQEGASAGVDGGNTAVITLRNITEGVDVATITLSADVSANAATALTLTGANADIAASDILGIVVTQGAAANLSSFVLQFAYQRQTVDAAGDLVASALTDSL